MAEVRHAQAEAQELLADGYLARVLEPSPPAVDDGDWMADDPASTAGTDADLVAVTPTTAGEILWDELAADDPDVAAFAAERWIGAFKELGPIPKRFVRRRTDFHRLAYSVLAEARHLANGKFGLRFTKEGFGTPFFGDDQQIRVEGVNLVVQTGDKVKSERISTLGAAGLLAGITPGTTAAEDDSPELGDLEDDLIVDDASGEFIADWFGFATSVLEEFRLTPGANDPSRVQLWPGHFDVAMEVGKADRDQRATYGASLGDDDHDEPYLYISPGAEVDLSNSFWNEFAFTGASVTYMDLLEEADPREAAILFFQTGHQLITRK